MGVWGVGVFQSDEASDARARFADLIGQGQDPQAASATVIDEFCFGLLEDFENNRIILALAKVEHDLGIADPHITEHALRVIDGEDLTEWGDEAGARKTVLENLRQKFLEDLPPRKVVHPRKFTDKSLGIGKHFLYTENSSGTKLLLRTVGIYSDDSGRYPRVTVLDWNGSSGDLERPDLLSPVRQHSPLFPEQIYVGALLASGRVKKANLIELPTKVHIESDHEYGQHFMRWASLVQHVRNQAITTPTTVTRSPDG